MNKSYIQKITPFIDNMRVQSEEEQPIITGLFKFKSGDKFIDFHFNTSLTLNKDDFNWVEGDGFISVIAALKWYQRGDVEDVDRNAFAVQYIPAGTIESIEEGRYNKDILVMMDFEGNIIYVNDAKEMNEFLGKGDYQDLEDGWQVNSFKEFIEKYEIDWDLSEDSYGELITQIPGEESYVPDYDQVANGKYYGFFEADYKK